MSAESLMSSTTARPKDGGASLSDDEATLNTVLWVLGGLGGAFGSVCTIWSCIIVCLEKNKDFLQAVGCWGYIRLLVTTLFSCFFACLRHVLARCLNQISPQGVRGANAAWPSELIAEINAEMGEKEQEPTPAIPHAPITLTDIAQQSVTVNVTVHDPPISPASHSNAP